MTTTRASTPLGARYTDVYEFLTLLFAAAVKILGIHDLFEKKEKEFHCSQY